MLWLRMPTAKLAKAQSDCAAAHQAAEPRAQLSVRYDVTSNFAVVKVAGADAAWFNERPWKTGVTVYTEANHGDLKALLQTAAWNPIEAGRE